MSSSSFGSVSSDGVDDIEDVLHGGLCTGVVRGDVAPSRRVARQCDWSRMCDVVDEEVDIRLLGDVSIPREVL